MMKTMSDLIKREDAIDALHKHFSSGFDEDRWWNSTTVLFALNSVPSADRPQGEWIEQDDCWQCSNCGDEFVLEVDVKPIDAKMHYCPNCGAQMKGADDERVR